MVWMKLLHQRTMRADDFLGARALRQAQDFIRFVARHRLAAPASPPPLLALTLVCVTPTRQTGGRDKPPVGSRPSGSSRRQVGIEVEAVGPRQRVENRAPGSGRPAPSRSARPNRGRAASRSSPNAPSRSVPARAPRPAARNAAANGPALFRRRQADSARLARIEARPKAAAQHEQHGRPGRRARRRPCARSWPRSPGSAAPNCLIAASTR